MSDFDLWFKKATGNNPYLFQRRLADADGLGAPLPTYVDIPTGCGKTAAVILGWLWRRRFHPDIEVRRTTPKRLVYCLPMRVLVEQTKNCAVDWLARLDMLSGMQTGDDTGRLSYRADPTDPRPTPDGGQRIPVYALMGGEIDKDWDRYPESDAVLIGTQDQLLSRALNRGYAMSRARWPMHFGLLNNDSLWVMDEVQLMGTGLATTLQLDAFRGMPSGFGHYGPQKSIWMSATMAAAWLETVDHPKPVSPPLSLSETELADTASIGKRLQAEKTLGKAAALADDSKSLAKEIMALHRPKTLTLVIVNTVDRAVDLHTELRKPASRKGDIDTASEERPEIVLLHSRFRPPERQAKVNLVLASEMPAEGRIVVSTQVVEAGVDISARTLFSELAPWSSLVQRFGRCNRAGEYPQANIYWIDVPEKQAPPYEPPDLDQAREVLHAHEGESMGPNNLPSVELDFAHVHIIRRKDMLELFDTTPDLAGNDIDVSRYIRDGDDHDAQVFWRDLNNERPGDNEPQPDRNELCSVSVTKLNQFRKNNLFYRWNFLEARWDRADRAYAGQVYLLDSSSGGYTKEKGWDGKAKGPVPVVRPDSHVKNNSYDADNRSVASGWITIAEHTDAVCAELKRILSENPVAETEAKLMQVAARWHDRGKAHKCFQDATPPNPPSVLSEWAKAPGKFKHYERKHFRHELASALAVLQEGLPDLAAYLVAAHHGKVRLSIRSLPDENHPDDDQKRFARGIWDGDPLPTVDLGGSVLATDQILSLAPMELGLSIEGTPSWMERILRLRDDASMGPFRLALLEALLRAADWRASADSKVAVNEAAED